ncbi:unnamed protein product [Cercospora beticola]|nr:unnamed protein product [Cercospora beticola]
MPREGSSLERASWESFHSSASSAQSHTWCRDKGEQLATPATPAVPFQHAGERVWPFFCTEAGGQVANLSATHSCVRAETDTATDTGAASSAHSIISLAGGADGRG